MVSSDLSVPTNWPRSSFPTGKLLVSADSGVGTLKFACNVSAFVAAPIFGLGYELVVELPVDRGNYNRVLRPMAGAPEMRRDLSHSAVAGIDRPFRLDLGARFERDLKQHLLLNQLPHRSEESGNRLQIPSCLLCGRTKRGE